MKLLNKTVTDLSTHFVKDSAYNHLFSSRENFPTNDLWIDMIKNLYWKNVDYYALKHREIGVASCIL